MKQWPASAYSVVLDMRLGKQPSLLPSQDDLLTSLQEQRTHCSQEGTAQGRGSPPALEVVPGEWGERAVLTKDVLMSHRTQETLMRDPDGSVYI